MILSSQDFKFEKHWLCSDSVKTRKKTILEGVMKSTVSDTSAEQDNLSFHLNCNVACLFMLLTLMASLTDVKIHSTASSSGCSRCCCCPSLLVSGKDTQINVLLMWWHQVHLSLSLSFSLSLFFLACHVCLFSLFSSTKRTSSLLVFSYPRVLRLRKKSKREVTWKGWEWPVICLFPFSHVLIILILCFL